MRKALAVLSVAVALAAVPALAQTGTQRSTSVEKGKPLRIAVITALKKDCSVGDVGTIRVITPPKNGQFAIRSGKVKTPASFRCPNVETNSQQLFYQSRANFAGVEEVSYETRTSDGLTETFTVKITVTDKPGTKKDGVVDL